MRGYGRTDPTSLVAAIECKSQVGRLYDAACLVSTRTGEGISGEPAMEVSTQNLTAAIAGRVAYLRGLA